MSSELISGWFRRKVGYGLLAYDEFGILKRTAELMQASATIPAPLRQLLSTSRTAKETIESIRQVCLGSPVEPLTHWTFFRGMFEGEHRFLTGALTTWDNEGVLTGDLLTELFRSVQAWGVQAHTLSGIDPMVHLCRVNTTFKRGEGLLGGDFGLIIQFGERDFFSFVIQVKLLKHLSADVSHHVVAHDELQRNILNRVQGLGHYLFVRDKFGDGSRLPPVMASARDVVSYMDADVPQGNSFPALEMGIDMAAYLSYGPGSGMGIGVHTETPEESVQAIFGGYPKLASAPERIFVIRLGSELDYDWNDIVEIEARLSISNVDSNESNRDFNLG